MEVINAAAIFAALNMICELIIIALVPPRTKLRVLGNDKQMVMVHCFLGAFTAIAKQVFFGYVRDGEYHRRLLGYKKEELI